MLVAAIVAACQGTVTPSGSATVAPVSPRPGSSAASASAGPSKAPGTADLFGTRYAAKAGPDGGSIVIGDVREANQFHPYFVTEDSDARVASAAWSTLVLHTPDDRYLPDLATGIPTLGNGVDVPGEAGDAMTVHWTLRPNLKWSDGEPLTCDDMKYAWEWVNDPQNVGVSQGGFENIKAFECASATDMTWHFDRVYAGYLTLLTAPLPRHYLAAIPMSDQTAGAGFRAAELAKIPVSGPFMFESATPGGELRMVRNANYAGPASGKPAHLGRLTWRWFADAKSLIAGYRNGDVDVATGLRDVDAASAANLAKQVSTIPSLAYELLRPNWSPTTCSTSVAVAGRGPGCPISDPAIRRAVQLTISRNDLNERLYGGALEVTDGNVPRTSWFFAGPPALVFDPAKARA
ncbi:MAG: peptide/nickel transport system substrate-binding protein, partial [Chloroflexota bacterium]|nr:peptide/nickel transport system substrate-binding protein [Chloroflexota bacterium]